MLRNLVNKSGKRLTELFNQLNRRLKSLDEKSQLLEVKGEGKEGVGRKKIRERSTSETTANIIVTDLDTV